MFQWVFWVFFCPVSRQNMQFPLAQTLSVSTVQPQNNVILSSFKQQKKKKKSVKIKYKKKKIVDKNKKQNLSAIRYLSDVNRNQCIAVVLESKITDYILVV